MSERLGRSKEKHPEINSGCFVLPQIRFISPVVSSLPPAFSPQASAVSRAALEVVQAWLLPEVASAPVVEPRAAEPLEADCAADARPAEGFADAVPEQPVSAAVDCLDVQVRVDYSAASLEDDSQDDSAPVDSAVAGLEELQLADSVPDVPQAGSVVADSAVWIPDDCSADSLLADLVALAQADSAARPADSVERAELRRDAHSLPVDCPVDSGAGSLPEQVAPAELLADSPLALVVRDVLRLGEHRAYRRLRSPVCREAQPLPRVVPPLQPQVAAFALRFAPAVVRDALPEPVVVSQKPPAGVEAFSWLRPAGLQSLREAQLHAPHSTPFRPERLRGWELLQPAHLLVRQRCRVHSPRPQSWIQTARWQMSVVEPPQPRPAHSDLHM